MSRQLALVRRPSPRLAEGLVTHVERVPVDAALAQRQWDSYVAAFRLYGWETAEVAPAEDCPDSAFVEDTLVLHRNVAVVTRPGTPSRQPETADAAEAAAGLGYALAHVREPGTLEGGDVLQLGDTVYVGRSGRTNAEGVRQLRATLEPLGARVVAVPLGRVLHLKSAVTALPDGTVIGYPGLLEHPGLFPRYLPVPEESGSHVVSLGEGRLLLAASAPATAELLADLGYEPVPVDISEFEKLEGCVTCLSVRTGEWAGR